MTGKILPEGKPIFIAFKVAKFTRISGEIFDILTVLRQFISLDSENFLHVLKSHIV
jgi:hypothetical protein